LEARKRLKHNGGKEREGEAKPTILHSEIHASSNLAAMLRGVEKRINNRNVEKRAESS